MLSSKRKFGGYGLGRRVKARKEEEPDVEVESSDAPSEEVVDASESEGSEEEHDGKDDSEEEEKAEDEQEERNPALDLSSISFGDLAKAHAAISKKSKKSTASTTLTPKDPPTKKPAPSKTTRTETPKRSSKHAPTEMSSKRPVSRKRDIIADTRPKPRDPRFDPLSGRLDEGRFNKAYAFLDSYRDDEIKQLRADVKKTKDAGPKEDLRRQLKSLEGKRETERKRAEEERVLEEHKKKEKELVKQGKQPFYLKKAEQKKRLLTERFKGMRKGQVEKAIVRRRKKEAARDRRELEEVERATGARARR